MGRTTFSGPIKSDAGVYPGANSLVTVDTATAAVTEADHAGRTVLISRAAGSTLTLPAATGSGATYKFVILTTVTSNAVVIQVTGDDIMTGVAIVANDGGATASIWETAADSDTITMNGSTTMGIKGDVVELQDIAADTWLVEVRGSATGTEATPFSAAVS